MSWKTINLMKLIICKVCNGSGEVTEYIYGEGNTTYPVPSAYVVCPNCSGKGELEVFDDDSSSCY